MEHIVDEFKEELRVYEQSYFGVKTLQALQARYEVI